ncbi:MAG: helix-turn-helix transcriptional regulator [Eubacteriales bacterium]|nr:helix-turn-helix transcriptional regulator [Eubacteriales bacterium]
MNVKQRQPKGFGKRLREAIADRGMTITEFSRRTGIVRNNIYGYIYYDSVPTIAKALRIAIVLNVSLDWLIAGVGSSEDVLYGG